MSSGTCAVFLVSSNLVSKVLNIRYDKIYELRLEQSIRLLFFVFLVRYILNWCQGVSWFEVKNKPKPHI